MLYKLLKVKQSMKFLIRIITQQPLRLVTTLSRKYSALMLLTLLLGGCEEKPADIEFSYGTNNVILPDGDGRRAAPVFRGDKPDGQYSSYPIGRVDEKSGEFILSDAYPGYRYLIRLNPTGRSENVHTFVTVAGARYPSRYFDLTVTPDTNNDLVAPTLVGEDIQFSNFALQSAIVIINDTTSRNVTKALSGIVSQQSGAINLRQAITNVFGKAGLGQIDLTISYQATLNGKTTRISTEYQLFRENIVSSRLRSLLHEQANFDKILKYRQNEFLLEKKVGAINEGYLRQMGFAPPSGNSVFFFTKSQQQNPPPPAFSIISMGNSEQ